MAGNGWSGTPVPVHTRFTPATLCPSHPIPAWSPCPPCSLSPAMASSLPALSSPAHPRLLRTLGPVATLLVTLRAFVLSVGRSRLLCESCWTVCVHSSLLSLPSRASRVCEPHPAGLAHEPALLRIETCERPLRRAHAPARVSVSPLCVLVFLVGLFYVTR